MKILRQIRFVIPVLLIAASSCVTLLVTACNFPQTVPDTLLPTNPPRLTDTSIPAPTPRPTSTPMPAPTPVPSDLIWFAPNMGSRDYRELFTKPDQWSVARSRINVFKFYAQNVLNAPFPIGGDNTLRTFVDVQAFQKLKDWGIAISVEVGAVKEYGCTGKEEFRNAEAAIQNIQANGGTVTFLAMDEPFIGGEQVIGGRACGYTMEQSATVTAQFIRQVKGAYPHIIVGDVEPYPYFSVPKLEQWIVALEDRGAIPAFFHLDVDIERVRVERQDVIADLRTLSQFFQKRRIPFGVIFTSNWHAAGSNRAYFDSTMEWTRTVNDAIGKPQHVIFQSWQGPAANGVHEVPINLPEKDPNIYSHTRLLIEGLAAFGQLSTSPPKPVPSTATESPLATPFTGTWQGTDPIDGSITTLSLVQTRNSLAGTFSDTYSLNIAPPGFKGSGSGTVLSATTAQITFNLTRWDGRAVNADYRLTLSNQNNTLTLDCSAGCPQVLQRQQ